MTGAQTVLTVICAAALAATVVVETRVCLPGKGSAAAAKTSSTKSRPRFRMS
jgi:hypothetical protein